MGWHPHGLVGTPWLSHFPLRPGWTQAWRCALTFPGGSPTAPLPLCLLGWGSAVAIAVECWKSSPQSMGFGTGSRHGCHVAPDAAIGLRVPRRVCPMHAPHPSSTSAFGCSCAFMHDAPFQFLFTPSGAPMCIPAEPDICSLPAWLQRLPQLSLCPPTPGGI